MFAKIQILSSVGITLLILLGCEKKSSPLPLPQGQLNLQVKEISYNRIVVEWNKIENAHRYELSLGSDIVSTLEALNYTIKDLSPKTEYTINLVPLNSAGNRGKKDSITITTLKKEVEIEDNVIIINPFIVAPLTAIIRIGNEQLSPESVEEITVKVLGKPNGGVDISGIMYPKTDEFKAHFFDITKDKTFNKTVISHKDSVEIPILGLYADYNNTIEYMVKTSSHIYKGKTTIQTDKLPDEDLAIEVKVVKPEKMEPGNVTWATADIYSYDFMFDCKGEIRWIINVKGNSDLRILKNGNLVIKPWWGGQNFGEYTPMGENINTWNIPNNFKNHHDLYEMSSGNFLVPVDLRIAREEGYTTTEDCILEIDRQTGEIVNYWDLFELMDIKNLQDVWFHKNSPSDWFHMNSLCYDEIKDEIIVSGKHGGVIKLSRNGENGNTVNKNKEIVWFMPRFDFYNFYKDHHATKNYILTAVNNSGIPYAQQNIYHDDFHWTKYQHNPSIIPSNDGTLHFLIFNNVYDVDLSAIVEYVVDEELMTVKQIWKYGENRPDLYGYAWSGTTFLPQTNNRIMFPPLPENPKVEVTIDKEIVFEYLIKSSGAPRWYRTGRINLYPITTQ